MYRPFRDFHLSSGLYWIPRGYAGTRSDGDGEDTSRWDFLDSAVKLFGSSLSSRTKTCEWCCLAKQAQSILCITPRLQRAVLGPVFVWMSLKVDSDIVFIIMFWVPYGLMFASISVIRMWIFPWYIWLRVYCNNVNANYLIFHTILRGNTFKKCILKCFLSVCSMYGIALC